MSKALRLIPTTTNKYINKMAYKIRSSLKKNHSKVSTKNSGANLHYWSFGRKTKRRGKVIKEIIAENFLNLGSDLDIQIYEDQQYPVKFNPMETIH
jgi:hypothetical protein